MNYKKKKARGFFDEEYRMEKLTLCNDPLINLNEKIDWEQFRPILEESLVKEDRGIGGSLPYDYVMMYKILILQRYNSISDDKMEYSILDRLSFMRFLGLTLSDRVPDAKTIWNFREQLRLKGVIEKLFDRFKEELQKQGLIANEGKLLDATFVEVPIQRNSRDENKEIKAGKVPEKWQEKPHKLSRKDTDARWTKKNKKSFFGYKNHIKADKKSKLIESYTVTDASVHDSQAVDELLVESDAGQTLHADSAYSGEPVAKVVSGKKMDNQIHEKGYRGRPLSEEQKERNREKSQIRARVEHVFGFMENSMGGCFIRTIGKPRAVAVIGLMNLTYNMFRAIQIGFNGA